MRFRDAPTPEIAEADILAVCEPGDDTIPRARRPAILSRPIPMASAFPRQATNRDVSGSSPPRVPVSAPWPKGVAQTESPFARRVSHDEASPGRVARTTPPPTHTADEDPATTMRLERTVETEERRFPWLGAIGFMGAGAAISAAVFFWLVPPAHTGATTDMTLPAATWAVEPAPAETAAAPLPAQKRPQLLTFDERDAIQIAEPEAARATPTPGAAAPLLTPSHHTSKARATSSPSAPMTPADVLTNALGPDPAPAKEDRPLPRMRPDSFAEAQLKAAQAR